VLIETTFSTNRNSRTDAAVLTALHALRGSFPVFAGDEKCVNFLARSLCPEVANNIACGSVLH